MTATADPHTRSFKICINGKTYQTTELSEDLYQDAIYFDESDWTRFIQNSGMVYPVTS